MVAGVMRSYPSYRLEDFYRKSFIDGGITTNQVMFLYKSADEERYDYYKFLGALQGVDLEEEKTKTVSEPTIKAVSASVENKEFMFEDPAVYEGLTEEEKAQKTQEMIQHLKGFKLKTSPIPQ